MKKILLLFFVFTLIFSSVSCGKSDKEAFSDDRLTSASGSSSEKDGSSADSSLPSGNSDLSVTSATQKNVETSVKRLITATDGTKIDSLTVMTANDAANSDNFKVYAIINWNRKYTPSDSKQLIQDYCNNIAASVDTELGNVQVLSLVWLASSFNGAASVTYEKTDGMLALKEEAFDKKFGVTSDSTTNAALSSSSNANTNTNTNATASAIR